MAGILLIVWLIAIPGLITGIVLTALGPKTRTAGLITLISCIVVLIVVPSICLGSFRIH